MTHSVRILLHSFEIIYQVDFIHFFSASESQSVENKLVYLLKLFDYSSIFSCWRVVFLFELINCSENSLLKPDRVGISGYTKISYLNRQLIIPPLVLSHQWALMICPPPLSPPRERCSLEGNTIPIKSIIYFILMIIFFSRRLHIFFFAPIPIPIPFNRHSMDDNKISLYASLRLWKCARKFINGMH